MVTCLNRWLGRCTKCSRDYNPHHPNNLDCKDYIPTSPITFYVQPEIQEVIVLEDESKLEEILV